MAVFWSGIRFCASLSVHCSVHCVLFMWNRTKTASITIKTINNNQFVCKWIYLCTLRAVPSNIDNVAACRQPATSGGIRIIWGDEFPHVDTLRFWNYSLRYLYALEPFTQFEIPFNSLLVVLWSLIKKTCCVYVFAYECMRFACIARCRFQCMFYFYFSCIKMLLFSNLVLEREWAFAGFKSKSLNMTLNAISFNILFIIINLK